MVKDVKNEVGVQKVMAHVLVEDDDDQYRKNRVLANVAKMDGERRHVQSTTDLLALTGALDNAVEGSLKGDPISRDTLDKVIAGLKQISGDLLTAASISTPQEMLEKAGLINRSLVDLKDMTGDPWAHSPDAFSTRLKARLLNYSS